MSDKKPFRKRLKNNVIYLLLLGLMQGVKVLPRPLSLLLARGLAFAGYWLASGERQKIHANLALAYNGRLTENQRHDIGKRAFRNIAQNLVDALLMNRLLRKYPETIMTLEGQEHVSAAMAKKKGVIFLTAHTGCFEMLSMRFSMLGFPMIVLGAKIYDPRLNDIIVANRKSNNIAYVERGQGLKDIYRVLMNGGGFGVLCDLDTRVESRFIDFFGIPAKTPSGPFRLGVKRGIPLVPVFTVRTREGSQRVSIFPELTLTGNNEDEKITNVMKQYNDILEALINNDPSQWIWMHERWKSKP